MIRTVGVWVNLARRNLPCGLNKKLLRNFIYSPKLTKGMQNESLPARASASAYDPNWKQGGQGSKRRLIKRLVMFKLICLLTMAFWLPASAKGFAQGLTLSLKNTGLEKVFAAIEQQSSYHFIYTKEELQAAKAVSISVANASLQEVMDHCLKGQPLDYSIKESYIIIKRKEIAPVNQTSQLVPIIINGRVTNEDGEPIAGATITIKGTSIATASNENGEWKLEYVEGHHTLTISSIGYTTREISISRGHGLVILQRAINSLDETVVIAYGKTTNRLNTGNVSKVSSAEIGIQPISNPLAALQGRVPGLEITQTSGVPGAGFKLQLRGVNSLTQGNEPLILLDGLPFGNGNQQINQLTSAASTGSGGISPFNSINVEDIASIEVLKDADATAIYGSRGANGVILITTKKGKVGKTSVNFRIRNGTSRATRTMDLLNTQQYLAMRREAFANDGVTPTVSNAPDLLVWDTTQYTDFKKMFTGGSARTTDLQFSVSGGTTQTQFLLNAGFYEETGFLSNSQSLKKKSLHLSLSHMTADKRAGIDLTASYALTNSDLLVSDMAYYINTAPHFPLYDSSGRLNWLSGNTPLANIGLTNPLADLERKYEAEFNNIAANLLVFYSPAKGLKLKFHQGFQFGTQDETSILPRESLDPSTTQLASAIFGNGTIKSWQAEPQVEYNIDFGDSKFNILTGLTFQERVNKSNYLFASNYSSDLLLFSPVGAGNTNISANYTQYRYSAVFARINYNLKNSYVVNFTGRRDGSSRFGPENRFANFGAVGAAWIFSENKWIKKNVPFLSFGKIRISHGVTGNDQIGDYRFLDTWSSSSSSATYQGAIGLQPTRLFNPNYSWEKNKKSEVAIDLGFFNDRILLSSAYYQNRCGNQLVNYALPVQTGFSSVQQNFDALLQNSGWEFSLSTRNIEKMDFEWSSSLNLSIPRNELISFPGLELTSYRGVFTVGQPTTIKKHYQYLGINPTTGIYQFKDVDSNGVMDLNDRSSIVNPVAKFYGGILNKFTFKRFQIDIFLEFRKQLGRNYLGTQGGFIPGYHYYNHPTLVLGRWQKPGDIGQVQRFVATVTSPALQPAQSWLSNSTAIYSNASFIRLKTLSLLYGIRFKKDKTKLLNISMQAQNLLTITKYVGADPENQNLFAMPPLKVLTLGLQLTL